MKRQVPIVAWEPPVAEKAVQIRHLEVRESVCACDEAWLNDSGGDGMPPVSRRLPVSFSTGARHDCKYVAARNEYLLITFPKLREEAKRAAHEATAHIASPAERNGERNAIECRYLDQLLTAKMNNWRYT